MLLRACLRERICPAIRMHKERALRNMHDACFRVYAFADASVLAAGFRKRM